MTIKLNPADLHYQFVYSGGPGGQHVNKTASAVLLRFNVMHGTLPENVRTRLIAILGKKISNTGDFIIKASRFRNQHQNKQDALDRLMHWIQRASIQPKKRKKTKPPLASKKRRIQTKIIRGKIKLLRSRKRVHEE